MLKRILIAASLVLMPCVAIAGPYEDGMAAYDSKDFVEAVKWFRKAAEQGHVESQWLLGHSYEFGRGVPQDYELAHMWFNIAAGMGHSAADGWRDYIATRMTPAQIAEAQKLAREWLAKHPQ